MPTPTTQRSRALALLGRRPILRLKDFSAQDVGPETLARLVRDGMIVRVARGLYQRANASVGAGHSLAEAAALVPKGVVCLISALQFHELTLQMPSEVWMAIDRTAWRPRIEYPPIRIVRFSGTALTDGVKHHCIDGVEVAITDPSRTIVDCFRYRLRARLLQRSRDQRTDFQVLLKRPDAIREAFREICGQVVPDDGVAFYDLWLIAETFELERTPLATAIRQTFARRETELPQERPTALTESYAATWDGQWRAFLTRERMTTAPAQLASVLADLERFLLPLLETAHGNWSWKTGTGWAQWIG